MANNLLPRRATNATRSPSVSQGHAGRYRRPMLPRIPPLAGRMADATRGAGVAAARARAFLAPGDELTVPRYLEVALVAALTVAALLLRAWNLQEAPVGIHGDETGMAMEALRSIRGESLGIWSGVTLGNPAGYAHWMAVIFRLADATLPPCDWLRRSRGWLSYRSGTCWCEAYSLPRCHTHRDPADVLLLVCHPEPYRPSGVLPRYSWRYWQCG